MYILMFILGVFCGIFGVGIVMASARQDDLKDAYEKGRADEKASIIEKVESKYGVPMGGNDDAEI